MPKTNTIYDQITARKQASVAAAKSQRSISVLKDMIKDAPDRRNFLSSISSQFGLIAEIKEKSPSKGRMRSHNVEEAPQAYDRSSIVQAISVLTNSDDFGMSIERLLTVKKQTSKPVLCKDFIFDEYQLYEARAFGADAVLLMTQKLSKVELQKLFDIACDLDLEVLVECGCKPDIDQIPNGAKICGINSRDMLSQGKRYRLSRFLPKAGSLRHKDFTTDLKVFKGIEKLPPGLAKVAESGINAGTICTVRDMGYNAALIGASLLLHPKGPSAALHECEHVLTSTTHAMGKLDVFSRHDSSQAANPVIT